MHPDIVPMSCISVNCFIKFNKNYWGWKCTWTNLCLVTSLIFADQKATVFWQTELWKLVDVLHNMANSFCTNVSALLTITLIWVFLDIPFKNYGPPWGYNSLHLSGKSFTKTLEYLCPWVCKPVLRVIVVVFNKVEVRALCRTLVGRCSGAHL